MRLLVSLVAVAALLFAPAGRAATAVVAPLGRRRPPFLVRLGLRLGRALLPRQRPAASRRGRGRQGLAFGHPLPPRAGPRGRFRHVGSPARLPRRHVCRSAAGRGRVRRRRVLPRRPPHPERRLVRRARARARRAGRRERRARQQHGGSVAELRSDRSRARVARATPRERRRPHQARRLAGGLRCLGAVPALVVVSPSRRSARGCS